MIGLVLVTHAGLATALKLSAEMIVGTIERCMTVEVAPDERADDIMARVVAAVEAVQCRRGYYHDRSLWRHTIQYGDVVFKRGVY